MKYEVKNIIFEKSGRGSKNINNLDNIHPCLYNIHPCRYILNLIGCRPVRGGQVRLCSDGGAKIDRPPTVGMRGGKDNKPTGNI